MEAGLLDGDNAYNYDPGRAEGRAQPGAIIQ